MDTDAVVVLVEYEQETTPIDLCAVILNSVRACIAIFLVVGSIRSTPKLTPQPTMHRLSCAVVSTVLGLLVSCTAAWPPPTGGATWDDITTSIFPPSVAFPVRPSALVDWNGDQYVDMVCIGNDATHADTFSIWTWQNGNHSFVLTYLSPSLSAAPGGPVDAIANIVATDFNRDGRNDAVILTQAGVLWALDGVSGNLTKLLVGLPQPIDGSTPQLSVQNVFGRCALPDLVVTTVVGELYVLRNNLGSASGVNCNFVGGQLSFTAEKIATSVVPLSVFSADLYGQCNAQLVYATSDTATGLSTFFAFDNVKRTSTALFSVPSYAGMPTAIDIDTNGAVDIVFPYCLATDTTCRSGTSDYSAVLFVYSAISNAPCGEYDCCSGFSTVFASVPAGIDSGAGYSVVSMADTTGCTGLATLPRFTATTSGVDMPLVLRLGDYNRDSFPDFALTSNAGPVLLTRINGASAPPQFSCAPMATTPVDETGIPFFFDVDEDGRLDVVVMHAMADPLLPAVGMSALWNGLTMHEDYFLTAVVLNGVGVGDATPSNPAPPGVGFPAWGASQVGAIHRFQWQDIETNVRTQVHTQQGNSQAHALQNPRVHFGLGRTFSYIQNYAAGIHLTPSGGSGSSSSVHYTWPSYLIPNSQVVAIPYPIEDPSSWTIKLFLSSSKFQTLLIISLCTALAVIGAPIVVLKYREVREDLVEMKRHA